VVTGAALNEKRKLPAEWLTPAEVKALLAACDGATLTGLRNRALVTVLWRSGLRCSEALDLRPVDVDFGAGTVRVLHGKGDRSRTVGIDGQALNVVRAWLGARQAAGLDSPWLFCSRRGERLSSRYVRGLVAGLAARAGIQHRCHPHALRHSMAVELVQEGWPLPLISRQLGHRSVATTDVYLANLQPAEVIARARSRSWG
jgi:site-specific recombinase XerD